MIVVAGAGGHGKVVADILLAAGVSVAGFIDDNREAGTIVMGLPVLGPIAWLGGTAADVALGLGDNAVRRKVATECVALGARLVSAIHPRAVVSPSARVGAGAAIMALAVLNPDAIVEDGAIINTAAIIEHDCFIGAFAHISPNAVMGGGCRVGALAHIGVGAVMLPRITVGERSRVGAGAVVTQSLPEGVVAYGVPARVAGPIP